MLRWPWSSGVAFSYSPRPQSHPPSKRVDLKSSFGRFEIFGVGPGNQLKINSKVLEIDQKTPQNRLLGVRLSRGGLCRWIFFITSNKSSEMFLFVILSGNISAKYFWGFYVVMGRPLSVVGSCDRCSRTERCTSAAVICENLDYKFQILSPAASQNTIGRFFDVIGWPQLHQSISRNLICNDKNPMVDEKQHHYIENILSSLGSSVLPENALMCNMPRSGRKSGKPWWMTRQSSEDAMGFEKRERRKRQEGYPAKKGVFGPYFV